MTRCQEVERWISCWIDGELPAQREAELMDHVEECSRCRTALNETRDESNELRRVLTAEPEELLRIKTKVLTTMRDSPPPVPRLHAIAQVVSDFLSDGARIGPGLRTAALVLITVTVFCAGFYLSRPEAIDPPRRESNRPLNPPSDMISWDGSAVHVHKSGHEEYGWMPVGGGSPVAARVTRDRMVVTDIPSQRDHPERNRITLELTRDRTSLTRAASQKWH